MSEAEREKFKAKFWALAAENNLTCCYGKHMTGGGPDKADVDAVIDAALQALVEGR